MSGATDKTLRDEAWRLLLERRADLYSRTATTLLDAETALDARDGIRVRASLERLRRDLRTSLAFLTDEVYEELVQIELLAGLGEAPPSGGEVKGTPVVEEGELRDRLKLLHVKLSRSLTEPRFQALEDIVGLEARLKKKLRDGRRRLEEKARQRELEERSWDFEAEAREAIRERAYKRAVTALREAIRLDPERPVFHNDLAFVYGLLGLTDQSVEEYKLAIELNESQPERRSEQWTTSYFNLGVALRKLADRAFDEGRDMDTLKLSREAISAFKFYVTMTPKGSKVAQSQKALVRLEVEVKELEVQLAGDSPEAEVA